MKAMHSDIFAKMFEAVAAVMNAKAVELCEMDARLGDGDLGLTMKKGFEALPALIRDAGESDPGKTLMKAGMKMASVVPSTMGTLMASGIMGGGKNLVGKEMLDARAYLSFLDGFCDGIKKRGKCARGDCTVLDAFGPAADSLREALWRNENISLSEAAEVALKGADAGVEATKSMEPKYGKAAVHKAAAAGTPDQGACAGMYVLQGIRDYFSNC